MSIEQARLDSFLEPDTRDLSEAAADALPSDSAAPVDVATADVPAPDTAPSMGDGVEVAGPVDAAARWLSNRATKATRSLPKIARGETKNIGNVIIANEADPAVAAQVLAGRTTATNKAAAKRAGNNLLTGNVEPAITGAPPVEPLNLDKQGAWTTLNEAADADSLRATIQQVNKAYGIEQPAVLTHAEVVTKAQEHGLDQVVERALTGKIGVDPTEIYSMLNGMTAGARRLDELATQISADPLNAALAVEFQQALAFQGTLQKAVKGVQVDIARSLGVFRIPREGKDTAAIQEMLDASGGLNNVAQLAERYLMLPTQAGRNALAERTMSTNVWDLWMTTWINGLLSSPVTHMRNIAGNAGFMAYQVPERALAGLIGNMRHVFGAEDFAHLSDAWAYASAIPSGLLDGIALGAKAFKENLPSDPVGKIESAMRQPGNLSEQFSVTGDWGKALDYYGTAITLPGRALMAEDELFKAAGYRGELAAIVNRARREEYLRLVQGGLPDDQAKQQADSWAFNALQNPSEEMDKAALAAARVATFTAPLEGFLGKLGSTLQHPVAKLWFPFVRTPANIMLETLKRTPAAFVSPSFWNAVKAGGVEADMAMAKASAGSAIMLGIGTTVMGDRLTGAGPSDLGKQEHLKNQGWQPFSVVFDKADVSDAELAEFNRLTGGMTRVGPNKVYVSYAGIEPFASILAMGATASETALEADDMQQSEKWMFAATVASVDYLGQQAMLKGVSQLVKDLGQGAKTDKSYFVSLLNNAGKTATSFAIGGSPAGAYQSALRAFERMVDPSTSNTMPPDMDTPAPVKGFWKAINEYRASLPGASGGLPPALNIWGEEKSRGFGDARDLIDPFFVSKGKLSEADAILVALGHPIKKPSTTQEFQTEVSTEFGRMASKGKVDLSAQQYNQMLIYANEVKFGNGTVKDAIAKIWTSPGFSRLPPELQQNTISGLYGEALAAGKARLLKEDPELQDRVRSNAEWHSSHPNTPQSSLIGH